MAVISVRTAVGMALQVYDREKLASRELAIREPDNEEARAARLAEVLHPFFAAHSVAAYFLGLSVMHIWIYAWRPVRRSAVLAGFFASLFCVLLDCCVIKSIPAGASQTG